MADKLVNSDTVRPGDVIWFSGAYGLVVAVDGGKVFGAWNNLGPVHWFNVDDSLRVFRVDATIYSDRVTKNLRIV
jgi:hypothetical protein